MKGQFYMLVFLLLSLSVSGQVTLTLFPDGTHLIRPDIDSMLQHSSEIEDEDGLIIKDGRKNRIVFSHANNVGSARITKAAPNTFIITGTAFLPYPDFTTFGKHDIIRLTLKINRDSYKLEPDPTFKPRVSIHPDKFAELLKDYEALGKNAALAGKPWQDYTKAETEQVLMMSYRLMLAAINGCKPCVAGFNELDQQFDMLNNSYAGLQHQSNLQILKNYGLMGE